MSFLPFREMPCGGGSSSVFPFNVITTVSGNSVFALVQDGDLLKSLRPSDKKEIVGLNQYFQVGDAYNIWLELQFNSDGGFKADPDGANINFGTLEDFDPSLSAWKENSYLELNTSDPNNNYQEYARVIIAQISGVGTPDFTAIQYLTTNLIMNYSCIDLRPAQFPIPSAYSSWQAV